METQERYAEHFIRLQKGGERNWVLHLNELAVDAMKNGDRELAERALDESILNINAVFGATEASRRARNVFFNEDSKLFKGDPYERSMAFFYRGILYMQERDWGNARAMFRSSVLQDAFAEENQFKADWVIFDYLIAVCEYQLGRDFYAEEALGRAREALTQPRGDDSRELDAADLAFDPESNLLVIFQQGLGPKKIRIGRYGQTLSYRASASPPPRGRVQACGERISAQFVDSLSFQATTRGGRAFDGIQNRKVIFKDVTGIIGSGSTWAGIFTLAGADQSGDVVAGVVMLGAGILLSAVSESTATKADVRMWRGLPEYLGFAYGRLCEGQRGAEVVAGKSRIPVDFHRPDQLNVILLFRDGSFLQSE